MSIACTSRLCIVACSFDHVNLARCVCHFYCVYEFKVLQSADKVNICHILILSAAAYNYPDLMKLDTDLSCLFMVSVFQVLCALMLQQQKISHACNKTTVPTLFSTLCFAFSGIYIWVTMKALARNRLYCYTGRQNSF